MHQWANFSWRPKAPQCLVRTGRKPERKQQVTRDEMRSKSWRAARAHRPRPHERPARENRLSILVARGASPPASLEGPPLSRPRGSRKNHNKITANARVVAPPACRRHLRFPAKAKRARRQQICLRARRPTRSDGLHSRKRISRVRLWKYPDPISGEGICAAMGPTTGNAVAVGSRRRPFDQVQVAGATGTSTETAGAKAGEVAVRPPACECPAVSS